MKNQQETTKNARFVIELKDANKIALFNKIMSLKGFKTRVQGVEYLLELVQDKFNAKDEAKDNTSAARAYILSLINEGLPVSMPKVQKHLLSLGLPSMNYKKLRSIIVELSPVI